MSVNWLSLYLYQINYFDSDCIRLGMYRLPVQGDRKLTILCAGKFSLWSSSFDNPQANTLLY